MLKVWLFSSKPNGAITGTSLALTISFKTSALIWVGIPTKPNSSFSGLTVIILYSFEVIEK